jgi:hypothetical protein
LQKSSAFHRAKCNASFFTTACRGKSADCTTSKNVSLSTFAFFTKNFADAQVRAKVSTLNRAMSRIAAQSAVAVRQIVELAPKVAGKKAEEIREVLTEAITQVYDGRE